MAPFNVYTMDHSKLSPLPLLLACTVLLWDIATIMFLAMTILTIMEIRMQQLNGDSHSNPTLSQVIVKVKSLKTTSNEVWREHKSIKNVGLTLKPTLMQYKKLMIGCIVDQMQSLSVV